METNKFNYLAYIGIFTFVVIGIIIAIGYIQGDGTSLTQINSTTIIGDKEKVYDAVTQTVTISDEITKESLVNIKLDTPIDNQVAPCDNCLVAQITCSNSTYCYPKLIELFNIKGNSDTNRKIDYKYLSIGTKSVNDYITECTKGEISKNGTISETCIQVLSGSHLEDEWLPYLDLKTDKPIVMGLFTEVKPLEKVEWIPTFTVSGTDIKVPEWATWEGNMSVNLNNYLPLNVSGIDTVNGYLSTTVVGATLTAGKINNSYFFDGNDYLNSTNTSRYVLPNYAISYSMWVKTQKGSGTEMLLGRTATDQGHHTIRIELRDRVVYLVYYNDAGTVGYISAFGAPATILNNTWTHIALTRILATDLWTVYLNGTAVATFDGGADGGRAGTTIHANTKDTYSVGIGAYQNYLFNWGEYFTGHIDEVGVWSRTLTADEVLYIYNSGRGCAYGNETCYTPQYCTFTGYVKDSEGSALNGANVIIINQTDNLAYYNITSDANGFWSQNVLNAKETSASQLYTVVAYYNNSLIGSAKPYVNSTCDYE